MTTDETAYLAAARDRSGRSSADADLPGRGVLPARRGWSWLAAAGDRCWPAAPCAQQRPPPAMIVAIDGGGMRGRWPSTVCRSRCAGPSWAWACCSSMLVARTSERRRVVGVHRLAAVDRGRADAGGRGRRSGAAVRRPGVDLDSHLRAAAISARPDAPLEAATKYFFLSILSSAMLLYGFSFLYGAAGSTELDRRFAWRCWHAGPECRRPRRRSAALALVLIFAGLAFRLTAVPFHFYAPDVYQGTTQSERRLAVRGAQDRRPGGPGADRRRWPCPASSSCGWQLVAGAGHAHDDAGQRAGPVAEQPPPAAGLFVDRACRLHADRPGGRVRRGRRRDARPSISTAIGAALSSIWSSTRWPRSARSPR